MLKRKKCKVCEKKVKSSQNFCPNCGTQITESPEKWGLLGKNDLIEKNVPETPLGMGEIFKTFSSIIKKTQNGTFNEKDFQKIVGQLLPPGSKLVVTKKVNFPEKLPKKDPNVKFLPIEFSKENLEKWKKVKKEEPNSKLKRVEDKIEYEVEVPGVKSIKDISIVKLENSLEIKAVADKTGYLKRIPINLPLKKYSLIKGILTLELDTLN
ncbi:MAG: hypothetical protein KKB62_03455 [Nanoarchaeota archaeon]|nr:hypothetical protein [Nanoarchaeota archaeon]